MHYKQPSIKIPWYSVVIILPLSNLLWIDWKSRTSHEIISFRPVNLIVPVTNTSFDRGWVYQWTMPGPGVSSLILSSCSAHILLILCLSPQTGLSSTISQGKQDKDERKSFSNFLHYCFFVKSQHFNLRFGWC